MLDKKFQEITQGGERSDTSAHLAVVDERTILSRRGRRITQMDYFLLSVRKRPELLEDPGAGSDGCCSGKPACGIIIVFCVFLTKEVRRWGLRRSAGGTWSC
jgi:hypothetical protein